MDPETEPYTWLVSQQTGLLVIFEQMKMTFDLPADIAQRLRVLAAEEGIKLKDLMAEACRQFLTHHGKPQKRKAGKLPFPLFKGGHPAKPGEELTPERVAEILWGSGQ